MPRYVGSGDYYTIRFIMSAGSEGSNVRFPTAPMYQDKESYSGRNRIWLKAARFGLDDANEWEENKAYSFMELEMGTASQNVYNGPMGNTDTMIGTVLPRVDNDMFSQASWWFAPTRYQYRDDLSQQEYQGATIGTFAVAGADIATGDTLTNTYSVGAPPVTTLLMLNKGFKEGGVGKSIQLHYDNDCYCPAKAVVVGQLWGSAFDFTLKQRSTRDNMASNKLNATMAGNVYFEIVVEPLLNEHIPRHMEMNDEKNRMKY